LEGEMTTAVCQTGIEMFPMDTPRRGEPFKKPCSAYSWLLIIRVLNFSPLIKGGTRSGPVLGSHCLKSRSLESELAPLGTKTHTL
jgi:hypothetical protein